NAMHQSAGVANLLKRNSPSVRNLPDPSHLIVAFAKVKLILPKRPNSTYLHKSTEFHRVWFRSDQGPFTHDRGQPDVRPRGISRSLTPPTTWSRPAELALHTISRLNTNPTRKRGPPAPTPRRWSHGFGISPETSALACASGWCAFGAESHQSLTFEA